MGYVDLHVHTTHSDGALSPAQMVEKAKAAGVTTLAIADHDKISGSQEAAPLCARAGIRLIPAAEVDTGSTRRTGPCAGVFSRFCERRISRYAPGQPRETRWHERYPDRPARRARQKR